MKYLYRYPFTKNVNKDRFIFLMNNYTALTGEETVELVQTQKEFPFSQIIHSLVAKGAISNNLEIKDKKLQTAAVYTTDRSVLKAIATAPKVERLPPPLPKPQPKEVAQLEAKPQAIQEDNQIKKDSSLVASKAETKEPYASVPEAMQKLDKPLIGLSGDQLIDELYHDLDKLKHLKHDYEVMVEGFIEGKEFSSIVIEDEQGNPVCLPPTEIRKGKEILNQINEFI